MGDAVIVALVKCPRKNVSRDLYHSRQLRLLEFPIASVELEFHLKNIINGIKAKSVQ